MSLVAVALAACGVVEAPLPVRSTAQSLSGGDNCSSFLTVQLDELVTGTTEGAIDDFWCRTGPDVVYGFVPPASGDYQALFLLDGGLFPDDSQGGDFPFLAVGLCDAGICGGSPRHSVNFHGREGVPEFLILESDGPGPTPYEFRVHTITPPPGDTCASPQPLELDVPLTVDVSSAFDDYPFLSGSRCGVQYAPDMAFVFTPPADGRYQFTTSSGTLWFNPVLCGEACAQAIPSFADQLTAGVPAYLVLESLARKASVKVEKVAVPPNDSCAGATALSPGQPVHGTTLGAVHDLDCPGQADVAYRFDAPDGGVFQAQLSGADGGPAPTIYLSASGCNSGACLGTPALDSVTFRGTPGSPVYLVVEGGDRPVEFDVVVQAIAPRGDDTCAAPTPLALGVPSVVSFAGVADDFAAPGCGLALSPDVVLSFTPVVGGRYEFSTTAGSLFIGTGACAASCLEAGQDTQLDLLAGVPAFVVVEGGGAAAATVLVRPAPPPANDGCGGAQQLELGIPTPGTTRGATDDACGPGPEVYYAFRAVDAGAYRARVTRTGDGGGIDWPLLLRPATGTCAQGYCSGNFLSPSTSTFNASPGTPAYLVVESSTPTVDFQVVVEAIPSTPHDTCADPAVLVPGVPTTLATATAADDYPGTGGQCGWTGSADLVCAFTPAESGLYRFSAQAASLFLGAGACGQACGVEALGQGPKHLQAGVTYTLLMETPAQPSASVLVERVPVPPNAQCAQAQLLPLGVEVAGGVGGAEAPGCNEPAVFYSFTSEAGGAFRVSTSPAAGAASVRGVPLLVARCVPGACVDRPAPSFSSATFRADAGEARLIAVVGADWVVPDFRVRVEALTPPSNDDCARPAILSLDVPLAYSLEQAVDDLVGPQYGCGVRGLPDLVFSFTPDRTGPHVVQATHPANFAIGLCGPACAPLSSRATLTAGVTYQVLVEGASDVTPRGQVVVTHGPDWVADAGPTAGGTGASGGGAGGAGGSGGGLVQGAGTGSGGGGGEHPGQGTPRAGCGCSSAGELALWPVAAFVAWAARRRRWPPEVASGRRTSSTRGWCSAATPLLARRRMR